MSKSLTNAEFGALGEKLAVKYLKQHGYKILEKNYKTLLGELDIVARIGETIVFAEVKTRPAHAAVAGMYAVSVSPFSVLMATSGSDGLSNALMTHANSSSRASVTYW